MIGMISVAFAGIGLMIFMICKIVDYCKLLKEWRAFKAATGIYLWSYGHLEHNLADKEESKEKYRDLLLTVGRIDIKLASVEARLDALEPQCKTP